MHYMALNRIFSCPLQSDHWLNLSCVVLLCVVCVCACVCVCVCVCETKYRTYNMSAGPIRIYFGAREREQDSSLISGSLIRAAKYGDVDEVKSLILHGESKNAVNAVHCYVIIHIHTLSLSLTVRQCIQQTQTHRKFFQMTFN